MNMDIMLNLSLTLLYFIRFNKKKRQNDWFIKAAEEIGVDIEDEGLYPLSWSSGNGNLCGLIVWVAGAV